MTTNEVVAWTLMGPPAALLFVLTWAEIITTLKKMRRRS